MKVAVMGVGRMGQRHVLAARQLGCEIVGIYDSNPSAMDQAIQEFGLVDEIAFRSPEKLLEKRIPECVIVSTTASSHCALTSLAAERGAKYILCEKPMAVSLAECDQMIAVCEKHGVSLAINHGRRFSALYSETKRLLESESFGRLASLAVVAGNLGISMNGSHFIELFLSLTGSSAIEVAAWLTPQYTPNPRGKQYEDKAGCLRFTTESGQRFYLDFSHDQGLGQTLVYTGQFGQLQIDELTGALHLAVRESQYRELPSTRDCPAVRTTHQPPAPDVLSICRDVLEALINNKSVPSPQEARCVIEVLVAAYVSNERGNIPVRLSEANLPRDRIFPWA